MPYNRQYLGWTGAASASTVVFPPQAKIRTSNTAAVNDPLSPVDLITAAPNPNEIWRLNAGTLLKMYIFDNTGTPKQFDTGQIYIGKRLLGNMGVRWYGVFPTIQIVGTGATGLGGGTNGADRNFQTSMQQTMRIHPGETLVMALNGGSSTATDIFLASDGSHQVSIPYEVAAGVSPAQMRASLKRWG